MKSKKCRGESGFTLSELLIVVAIIAVLVAVSIPIFTKQLEKSREATDLANMRAAKAAAIAAITNGEIVFKEKAYTPVPFDRRYYDAQAGTLLITGEDIIPYGKGTTTVGSEDNYTELPYRDDKGYGLILYDPASSYVGLAIEVTCFEDGEVETSWWNPLGYPTVDPDSGAAADDTNASTNAPTNTATANNIGSNVINLLNNVNAPNNTKVVITVRPSGEVEINNTAYRDQIMADLKNAGFISSDGKVAFNATDNVYPNGYEITINNRNKPHIKALK